MPDRLSFHNAPIIIDSWNRDDTYEGVYPSGARVKDASFSPDDPNENCIKPDWRYLFKLSRGVYEPGRGEFPWQFWCEIIAYRFGCVIGVDVPPAHIGLSTTYKQGTDTYAALIEWFYDDKEKGYIPGGQFMQLHIKGYDRVKGEKHNLTTILSTIGSDKFWLDYWAQVLVFDSLIGNTDRHQDNWGLTYNKTIKGSERPHGVNISPAFDNGTALGYEILEENLQKFNDTDKLKRYLNHSKARHHMKWSLEDSKQMRFYEFIRKFSESYPEIRPVVAKCLIFTRQQVEEVMSPLVDAISDPKFKLTQERLDFMLKLIFGRKQILEEVLEL
jgi:hypothetical protein